MKVILLYKIIWKLLSSRSNILEEEYIQHQEIGHQAVLSAEIAREQRDAEAENLLK